MKKAITIKNKKKLKVLQNKPLEEGKLKEYLLIILLLNTGIRLSDILRLKWENINSSFKLIYNLNFNDSHYEKKIIYSDKISNCLRSVRNKFPNDRYIFESKRNKNLKRPYWSRSRAYQVINKYAKKAGFNKSISAHSLRKSFGYFAFKKGISLRLINRIYNQSTKLSTIKYIGLTSTDLKEIQLDKIFE